MRTALIGTWVALVVSALMVFSEPAYATSCSSKCYARGSWAVEYPAGFRGGAATLNTHCITVSDPTNNFLNNALWVGKYPHDGTSWLEAGITVGEFYPDGYASRPVFYYASRPQGGSYSEQSSGVLAPLGQDNRVSIHYSSGTEWTAQITFNSGGQGRSISKTLDGFEPPAKWLVAGLEATRLEDRGWVTDTNLYYRDLSNGDHPNWSTAGAGDAVAQEAGSRSDVYWINAFTAFDASFGYHTCG